MASNRFQSRIPEISKRLPLQIDIAVTEGAEVIKELAQAFCPYDPGGTVHLRDAIHVERSRESSTGRSVVAWSREAWYGHLVEWGSVHSNTQQVWRIAPNPFMERAVVAGRSTVVSRADRAIKAACNAGTVR